MNPLLAQFIPEARDLIEQASSGILDLERASAGKGVVDDIFRAVHTLKGSSGLFEISPLTRLVHAAEDLLGEARAGHLALEPDIVDELLLSLDVVGRWIDALEERQVLPHDAEAEMTERVLVLRGWLGGPGADHPAEPSKAAGGLGTSGPQPPPDWLAAWSDDERASVYRASMPDRGALIAWSFDPPEGCFFNGDDPVALVRCSPGLAAVRVRPAAPWPAPDALDPFACRLRFEALSFVEADDLLEHVRYVSEHVVATRIDPVALAMPVGEATPGELFHDFAERASDCLATGDVEALRRCIGTMVSLIGSGSLQASALRWLGLLMADGSGRDAGRIAALIACVGTGRYEFTAQASAPANRAETPSSAPDMAGQAPAVGETAKIALARKLLEAQLEALDTPTEPAVATGRFEAVAVSFRNIVRSLDRSDLMADVERALAVAADGDTAALRAVAQRLTGATAAPAANPAARPEPAGGAAKETAEAPGRAQDQEHQGPDGKSSATKTLRVDQAKIDALMNLVAELIVAKNGISYLAKRAETVYGSRELSREIKEHFSVIDRVTQGLQVGVMSVRMMPVSQVFQRFPRLVRDISRRLAKHVDLVIEGEDTEADKNVLESLTDPLIHMVRNCLDHGIEAPDVRRAAGKPAGGTVRLTARQENDNVIIEVADDGKGIDPEVVKAKAVKIGMIDAQKAAQLDDAEAANLVFAAGFSTCDEVSDLSGRGVGMDAVRAAVQKAGGDVMLRSRKGDGTTVTLRLPLTMAVTRIVTIECRGHLFGVPMDLVAETVKVRRNHMHRIKDREAFILRDAVVPVLRLADCLHLAAASGTIEPDEEVVMIARIGGARVGVVVDGFRERMEVIVRPCEGLLVDIPSISGTALLGDGHVLLVLDLKELL